MLYGMEGRNVSVSTRKSFDFGIFSMAQALEKYARNTII